VQQREELIENQELIINKHEETIRNCNKTIKGYVDIISMHENTINSLTKKLEGNE